MTTSTPLFATREEWLVRGIEEQATQDDLAAGVEATAFGGNPGVERIEASLGLGDPFLCQFESFGGGSRHTFSASKHDHGGSIAQTSERKSPGLTAVSKHLFASFPRSVNVSASVLT